MRGENLAGVKTALGGVQSIGAGETESLACAPAVLCVNDVRIVRSAYSERRTGAFDRRADLLGPKAFEHLRMLLNRCDHVIVLLQPDLMMRLSPSRSGAHAIAVLSTRARASLPIR